MSLSSVSLTTHFFAIISESYRYTTSTLCGIAMTLNWIILCRYLADALHQQSVHLIFSRKTRCRTGCIVNPGNLSARFLIQIRYNVTTPLSGLYKINTKRLCDDAMSFADPLAVAVSTSHARMRNICEGSFGIRRHYSGRYYEHSLSSRSAIYLTKWLRRSYVSIMSITKRY